MSSSGTKFKPDLAASVLLYAAYVNDEAACKKFGVSLRSLQNWRRRLHEDRAFAGIFATKQKQAESEWAENFMAPLVKASVLLSEMFEAVRNDRTMIKNPVVMASVSEAARTCADIVLTNRAINAQFSNPDQPPDQLSQEVSPSLAVEYTN